MGNLPILLTRLVGRGSAVRELGVALWEARLLCLCGPGGAGKTRLAVALAEAVRADFVGGVWWVDLSATRDSRLVTQAVCSALVPGEPISDPAAVAVAERFRDPTLIVLDNCEQVIDGCAELVSGVLGRSQSIRVIATSRQPLGIAGERIWHVSGLRVASDHADANGDAAADGDAIALFVQRVREAGGSVGIESRDVRDAVASICASLDGLPLALELAAARVRLLGVTQIAEHLQRDSDFLRHPGRGVPERHRTLRQALDWSHDLLTAGEQALFRRLSVFRGDFSLHAVQRICADPPPDGVEVLDVLSRLVDQSLVQVLDDRLEPRYRLLQTIHRYATERLTHSGERDAVGDRHARYFAALLMTEEGSRDGREQDQRLDVLELEHDNVAEAMNRLLAHAIDDAAMLAVRIWPWLHQRGYYREARLWLEALMASASRLPEPVRAQVLLAAGEVAFLQCDYEPAAERLHRALELTDDLAIRAAAQQLLGSIAREQGRYEQARASHQHSLQIWESLGDRLGIAASRDYQGFIAWLGGDCAGAQALCALALSEFRQAGAHQRAASALVNLGAAAVYSGDPIAAREHLEHALAISRRLGFQEGIAWSLHELAILSRRRRGPVPQRAQMLRDALITHHQLGDRWRLASVLEEIAGGLLGRSAPATATALLGFAAQLRDQLTTPVPPVEQPDRDHAMDRLRGQLGPAAFAGAWSDGTLWRPAHAVAVATDAIDELTRDTGVTGTPILTARELAVLELLSQGNTNREIAAALYISPSTAGVHVSNILRKLGAKRRVDAAGIAHRLELLSV